MRRVSKGAPIQDSTKGSWEYAIYEVDRAFRMQFGLHSWDYCICDTFADHIILRDFDLPQDEYWLVNYTKSGDTYTFAAQDAWERVQLDYTPARNPAPPELGADDMGALPMDDMGDRAKRRATRRRQFVERVGPITLVEAAAATGDRRRVRGIGMTAGSINENMRRYPAPVIADAVDRVRAQLENPAGRIGRGPLLGEAEHPTDRGESRPLWLNTVFVWDNITFANNQVVLDGYIVPTAQGQDAIVLLEHAVLPGLSLRGYGMSTLLKESGVTIEQVDYLELTGWDATIDPADQTADLILAESRRQAEGAYSNTPIHTPQQEDIMRKQPRRLAESDGGANPQAGGSPATPPTAVAAPAAAAALAIPGGLSADDRARLDRLAEAERRQTVNAAIDAALEGTPYAPIVRAQIADAVRALDLTSPDAVPPAVERQRAVADSLLAEAQLALMGRPSPRGPVISGGDSVALVPEYAKPQLAIADSIVLATGKPSKLTRLRTPQSVNERFAAAYLKKFDAAYKHHLIREAREFADAEQSSDLNLPYTIMRTVIAELVPELIAVSVFDVATVDAAPTVNVPYETYTGESGLTATITDEAVTSSDDTWVALAHAHLTPGTVVVTSSPAGTTYVEGTDYVVDYLGGRLKTLSVGAINNATAILVDYGYTTLRKGEMQPISRGKMQINFFPLTIAADRLATQISSEAMVFSRAVLGYDAVGRALARIMFEVRRSIDGGLFYLALAEALQVANNSGGTWTAATDTFDDLVQLVGVAKVKIANRFFPPTAIIMSETNADRIANWIGFTQAGSRPDADLNAAGYVGRLKGLPVFATTEFTDGYILPCNREVVYYRVGQAMQLRGPFPTYYTDGSLIAADQYYVEEYNGATGDPGKSGKASFVKIA